MVRGRQKIREGLVVSDKVSETAVVLVTRKFQHPQYGKVISTGKHFHAHNPDGKAHRGDWVQIVETRPLSRLKRWRIAAVLQRREASQRVEAAVPEEVLRAKRVVPVVAESVEVEPIAEAP